MYFSETPSFHGRPSVRTWRYHLSCVKFPNKPPANQSLVGSRLSRSKSLRTITPTSSHRECVGSSLLEYVLRTFEAFGLVESTTPQISPETLFDNSFASASKGAGETKGIGPISPETENAGHRYLLFASILVVVLLIFVLVGWYVAYRRR
jgi:hypothetical protein